MFNALTMTTLMLAAMMGLFFVYVGIAAVRIEQLEEQLATKTQQLADSQNEVESLYVSWARTLTREEQVIDEYNALAAAICNARGKRIDSWANEQLIDWVHDVACGDVDLPIEAQDFLPSAR